MSKKILIVTQVVDSKHPVLGFFIDWICEFAKHAEKVTVICLQKGTYSLPENVTVLSLGKEKKHNRIAHILKFYRYIWQKKHEYDVVFVHMNPEYVLLGGLFWRIIKKQCFLWYVHKSVNMRLRLAERLTTGVFTASEKSFRLLSSKVNIVGHGIDTDSFRKTDEGTPLVPKTIIQVGRIDKTKNQFLLLNAIHELVKKNVSIQAIFIGAPANDEGNSYLGDMRQYVFQHDLGKHVSFAGPQNHSDLPMWYSRAALSVNLSNTGSMDKDVLEAMSCKCLCVTSNEAFKGIIPNDLYLESKDPLCIAEKISSLLSIPEQKRVELAANLRTYVAEEHSLTSLIYRICSIMNRGDNIGELSSS